VATVIYSSERVKKWHAIVFIKQLQLYISSTGSEIGSDNLYIYSHKKL